MALLHNESQTQEQGIGTGVPTSRGRRKLLFLGCPPFFEAVHPLAIHLAPSEAQLGVFVIFASTFVCFGHQNLQVGGLEILFEFPLLEPVFVCPLTVRRKNIDQPGSNFSKEQCHLLGVEPVFSIHCCHCILE